VLIGLAAGILDRASTTGDMAFFAQHGDLLLSDEWRLTFADTSLQAGPLLVAGLALLGKSADLIGTPTGTLASPFLHVLLTVSVAWAAGLPLADRPAHARSLARIAVAAGLVLTGMTHRAYWYGHPAQILIPVIWIAAARLSRDGRTVAAGAILGLGAGLETWAILGLPVLLLAPGLRRAAAGAGVAILTALLLFLPFVALGQFHMFEYRWLISGGTPLSLVLETGTRFPWSLRLVQGVAAVGAGVIVAWRLRPSPSAFWAVPLTIVVVRLLLEPTLNMWYTIALGVLGLVAAADIVTGGLQGSRRRSRTHPHPA
jgi:hypothetical protein